MSPEKAAAFETFPIVAVHTSLTRDCHLDIGMRSLADHGLILSISWAGVGPWAPSGPQSSHLQSQGQVLAHGTPGSCSLTIASSILGLKDGNKDTYVCIDGTCRFIRNIRSLV